MKGISLLGSTGSVGVTTLDVVSRFPDRFRIVAMAAGQNLELLVDQIKRFQPELVSVATPELARDGLADFVEGIAVLDQRMVTILSMEGLTASLAGGKSALAA